MLSHLDHALEAHEGARPELFDGVNIVQQRNLCKATPGRASAIARIRVSISQTCALQGSHMEERRKATPSQARQDKHETYVQPSLRNAPLGAWACCAPHVGMRLLRFSGGAGLTWSHFPSSDALKWSGTVEVLAAWLSASRRRTMASGARISSREALGSGTGILKEGFERGSFKCQR